MRINLNVTLGLVGLLAVHQEAAEMFKKLKQDYPKLKITLVDQPFERPTFTLSRPESLAAVEKGLRARLAADKETEVFLSGTANRYLAGQV